ncbi:MAG: PaaI family thioesterase [Bryobacteraceae bacterium]
MAFEDFLSVRVVRRGAGGVTCRCRIRPDLLNTNGVLHGGVAASIADEAAWHCLNHRYGPGRDCTTSDLKINYLRPLSGENVTARGTILRAGRTFCVSRIDLLDPKRRLCAVAIVSYMLLDGAQGKGAAKT